MYAYYHQAAAKMDARSLKTLHRVEENDDTLTELRIGKYHNQDGSFTSEESNDFCKLGAAIGKNTQLQKLVISLRNTALTVADKEFYDGLRCNSSICEVAINGDHHHIIGSVLHEILKAIRKKEDRLSRQITSLDIQFTGLENGGDNAIAATLRRSINLKKLYLAYSDVTDVQLCQ